MAFVNKSQGLAFIALAACGLVSRRSSCYLSSWSFALSLLSSCNEELSRRKVAIAFKLFYDLKMNPNFLRQIIVISLLFMASNPSFGKPQKDPSNAEFVKLEAEATKFAKDKKAQKMRHNFERLAAKWESFAKKHQSSPKASVALIKAADLYEKVAGISQVTENYEKAAEALFRAADKTSVSAEQDKLLMRAMRLYVVQLSDREAAALAIGSFLKRKSPKKKVPNAQAWYAEYQAQKKAESKKAEARKPTVVAAKPKEEVAETKIEHIKKVDLLKSEDGVGLAITISGEIQIKQGVIPKSDSSPRRVFFDLSPSELDKNVKGMIEVSQQGIKQIRLGQNKSDVVRIVAEAEASMPIHVRADVSPIEIWFGQGPKVDSEDDEEGEEPVAATPAPKIESHAPLGLALRKIVIDAGHGGHDPGAIGRGGLKEKDVTLSVSKKLKVALEEQMPGVKVYLTRDTDKYLALGERTEFANNLDADLFLSVHVNASPNRKTQGIETYYLNISHDRYAVRLASRENAMSESEISNLEFILADLAMKSNVSDSVRLGREVQASTCGHLQGSWSDVKDLGLKHALFYVLLGARMPAVLIETAFISNREDEKRLRTEKYQDALVNGMVKGILRYSEQKQAMYQP